VNGVGFGKTLFLQFTKCSLLDMEGWKAFAIEISSNRLYLDRSNKRTAWVVARLFLADNAIALKFDEVEAIQIMLRVASGEGTEQELAQWFRHRSS
jgi:death on curing protein